MKHNFTGNLLVPVLMRGTDGGLWRRDHGGVLGQIGTPGEEVRWRCRRRPRERIPRRLVPAPDELHAAAVVCGLSHDHVHGGDEPGPVRAVRCGFRLRQARLLCRSCLVRGHVYHGGVFAAAPRQGWRVYSADDE